MDFKARTSEEEKNIFLRKPWHHWKEREVDGGGARELGRKEERRQRKGEGKGRMEGTAKAHRAS